MRRAALAACMFGMLPRTAYAGDDWFSQVGFPGALQTPSAFMAPEGALGFGISRTPPYNTLYISMQPFAWLNFGARYTDITDRPYRTSTTGQSFKDKAFDVALRLYEGDSIIPALGLGIIDLGGTGNFSSEYIVASQRIFDLHASLGIGWGRLGTAGDFENPLTAISDRVRRRPGFEGGLDNTGTVAYDSWFRGENVALFGSLVWRPSFLPAWSLIAEFEGNDYSDEPATNPVEAPSRFNFGIGYRMSDDASLGVSYLRGDTLAFEIGIHPLIGVNEKPSGKAYLPVLDKAAHPNYRRRLPDDEERQLGLLYDTLHYSGFFVHAMDLAPDGDAFTIWQSNAITDDPLYVLQFVGRHAANFLPERVRTITVVSMAGGAEAVRIRASRWLIEAEASGLATPDELVARSEFAAGQGWALDRARYTDLLNYPTFAYGVSPALRSNIGGPTEFFVGQLLLKPYVTWQLSRSFSMTTTVGVSLLSELGRLTPVRSGSLPRVRSDLELYQSGSGNVYLEELEANWLFPLGSQWYGRISAGIFEEMFGGVGSEVLYRPYNARWALSLNANYVKQRDYDQGFEFRDYEVATGHLTFYYRAPIEGIVVQTSVGRYLARDVGVTLDVAREFRNGARFGVFASKTDASSAEFGEGSFDKGFYVYFPLSQINKGLKGNGLSLNYRFLSRDGGQKVDDGRSLYSVYGHHSAGAIHER
ncbi:YjbH domain-containing protein [Sinimarinibacterium flocculans]|uniref:YjbH domain-containing protein n=1 Tax=Sinimarinibacterium flocculans TaxID=985250 RepID=UPI00351645AD